MKWLMVGCSHHNSPIQIRERLAFTPQQAIEALNRLQQRFPGIEGALLSTCNRVEIYAAGDDDNGLPSPRQIGEFFAEFHDMDTQDVLSQLTTRENRDAISHLFQVAASLDSLVVGEAQIISQVKQAYELACQANFAGPLTHAMFQHASHVAKRVTNETEIHRRRISVPSVAVSEVAGEFFERFDDKNILLIGAGEMGEETLRYLVDAGAKKITVVNRGLERATQLAERFFGTARPWEDLNHCIASADLIISTTGSTETIVKAHDFSSILSSRTRRGELLILDLAVPRDFDPKIADLDGVYLFTVDDLQQVCQRNQALREKEWPKAKQIIEDEIERFTADINHRATGPTILRLREQASAIKQAELDRLVGRMTNYDVDPKVISEISQTLDRLVNKLLHPPLESLRQEARTDSHDSLLKALKRLFQLND